MLHRITTEQLIRTNRETLWEFIGNPLNLEKITPPYMGFEVLGSLSPEMYPGQIIEYYVRPLLNIKLHWVTEITHVKEGFYFVDEQRAGPYAFWHHQHSLQEVAGGVLMKDQVHYQLPFSALGKLANSLFVKQQLAGIFDYRKDKLDQMFNKQVS